MIYVPRDPPADPIERRHLFDYLTQVLLDHSSDPAHETSACDLIMGYARAFLFDQSRENVFRLGGFLDAIVASGDPCPYAPLSLVAVHLARGEEAREWLARWLRTSPTPAVRRFLGAGAAFRRIGEDLASALITRFDTADADLRQLIVLALSVDGNCPTVEELLADAALRDPDSEVRALAVQALGWGDFLTPRTRDLIVALADDEDPVVRSAVAFTCSRVGRADIGVTMLEDVDHAVRMSAVRVFLDPTSATHREESARAARQLVEDPTTPKEIRDEAQSLLDAPRWSPPDPETRKCPFGDDTN
ncbi:MAG: HEAT repeat domain-containing protein [Deltaproteobacteria bacterium]|nr:HEAT repeat domain-containing protein [Deltaproteobacteria bacterium]